MGLDDEQDVNDLLRLRKAKVTKHFTHEGKVIDEREYEDNQTQLKALEVTLKLKGHLRNRVEHSGKVDGEGNKFLIQFINKKEDIVKDAEATAADIRLQEKLRSSTNLARKARHRTCGRSWRQGRPDRPESRAPGGARRQRPPRPPVAREPRGAAACRRRGAAPPRASLCPWRAVPAGRTAGLAAIPERR